MSSPYRLSNVGALALVALLVTLLPSSPVLRQTTWFVDINDATCGDVPGKGTKADPYCSVKYAASVAVPGDTFEIQAGMYFSPTGPTVFSKSGTSANPITYRGIGDVWFSVDLPDNSFTPSPGLANVYQVAYTGDPGAIAQVIWDPFVIDDPNPSIFTMIPEDGPLRLNEVFNDTDLVAREGTWRLVAGTPGTLYVHAYDDRVVGTATTNLIAGGSGQSTLTTNTGVQWNVYENFRIIWTWNLLGSNNVHRNIAFQTALMTLQGANNTVENMTATHGITRLPGPIGCNGCWSWDEGATGGGIAIIGPGHRLKNIEIYHNWNSGVSTAEATGLVIENIISRAAPNHCTVTGGGDSIVRNAQLYNCQDYIWENKTSNFTLEHWTAPSGIGVEALVNEGPLGPVIVRNSIFSGGFEFIRGPNELCTFEAGSIVENSVINKNAQVEHCTGTGTVDYTVEAYIAACNSKAISPCITYRNNVMLNVTPPDNTPWKTVMVDGMWNAVYGDSWDARLVPGSPAIDIGTTSGTAIDLLGITRPQGKAKDAGAYEYTVSTPLPATGLLVGAQAKVTTTITAPTSATTYDAGTAATLTTLAGTAVSSRPITGCTWINSLGGSGAASGAGSWTVPSIPLTVGSNVISVTCTNNGKTASADSITVTRSSGGAGPVDCAAAGNQCYWIANVRTSNGTGTEASPWKSRSNINWTTVTTALATKDVYLYFSSRSVWNDAEQLVVTSTGTSSHRLWLIGDERYTTTASGTAVWSTETTPFTNTTMSGNMATFGSEAISSGGFYINSNHAYITVKGIFQDNSNYCFTLGDGGHQQVNIHDITLDNVKCDSPENFGHGVYGGGLTSGCYNIVVRYSTFINTDGESIYVGQYNYFANSTNDEGQCTASGGTCTNSITGTVVEYNVIINPGVNVTQGDIDIKPGNNGAIIRYNRFSGTGTGSWLAGIVNHANGSQIYGNDISTPSAAGQDGNGININAAGDAATAGQDIANVLVYNNVIRTQSGQGISVHYGGIPGGNITGLKILNNTIVSNTSTGIDVQAGDGKTVTISELHNNILSANAKALNTSSGVTITAANNNLMHQAAGTLITYQGTNRSWAQWQALGFDANGVNAAPNLNATTMVPNAGSPAINAGSTQTEFTVDKNETTRTGTWDIGAYDTNTAPAPAPSLLAWWIQRLSRGGP